MPLLTPLPHTHLDSRIAAIASKQLGVVTFDQLVASGLSPSAISKRTRAGRMHRIFPRTFAIGHTALPYEALVLAAQLSIGPDAVASGRCAAWLWGFYRRGRAFVEVTSTRRHRGLDDVIVRFTRSLPDDEWVQRHGGKITTPARSIVDIAEHRTAHQVAHAIHEARRQQLLRLPELERLAARHDARHGHPTLVRALHLHRSGSAGTRSTAEDKFLELLAELGVPEPQVNVHVTARRRKFEVDCFWPERKLCVEVDGPEHALPERLRLDRERDERLVAAGFEVIRVPVAFLVGGAERVAARFPR